MLTVGSRDAYMKGQTPASSLQPVKRQVDDMKTILTLLGAALIAAPAAAAPVSVQDRINDLCSVSATDLEGQRLARTCRAEVRARFEAERLAATKDKRPFRTAAIEPLSPR